MRLHIKLVSVVQRSLNFILMTLALLVIASFLLVPIFNALSIPSFTIGTNNFWILRWENTSQGFGIGFNWLSILILTLVYLLLGIVISIFHKK